VSRETWIDRQIREAQERGAFDDLPGAGKPLPDLDRPRDDLWWVKRLMRREGLSITPPLLELRRDREDARRLALDAATEAEARDRLEEINARIRAHNATAVSGPPSNLAPIDVDAVLWAWRQSHPRSP
jgi:hypothetical protein